MATRYFKRQRIFSITNPLYTHPSSNANLKELFGMDYFFYRSESF